MLGQQTKKLIIVTGVKENVYAELLSSLVTLKDDDIENNTVVGIKDGSVEAVVWDEKVYNDNRPTISSNQKVIFIGKTKAADLVIPNIRFDKTLKKYGINVGAISNKAVIYIESDVLINTKELYDEFYEKYYEKTKEFDNDIADTNALKKGTHTDTLNQNVVGGAIAGGVVSGVLGGVLGGLFGGFVGDFLAKKDLRELIPDQMFRYAILDFYLNKLSDFMEIK